MEERKGTVNRGRTSDFNDNVAPLAACHLHPCNEIELVACHLHPCNEIELIYQYCSFIIVCLTIHLMI